MKSIFYSHRLIISVLTKHLGFKSLGVLNADVIISRYLLLRKIKTDNSNVPWVLRFSEWVRDCSISWTHLEGANSHVPPPLPAHWIRISGGALPFLFWHLFRMWEPALVTLNTLALTRGYSSRQVKQAHDYRSWEMHMLDPDSLHFTLLTSASNTNCGWGVRHRHICVINVYEVGIVSWKNLQPDWILLLSN